LSFIEATQLCLATTQVEDEASDSWMSVSDYSSADWIYIEQSVVDSAHLKYFVSMTGSSISSFAAVNGLNLVIDELNASNVSSAVLNWNTSSDAEHADYYLATLNVSNSRFSTTALLLQLGRNASNEESAVSFAANEFSGYQSYYAEPYLLSLDTKGAPLRCNFASNVFVDGANDVDNYLELKGPMDVVMTNQSVDQDSSWLYAVDVASMAIHHHEFGPNFLSSAIVMERVDVALTPSVSISIEDSRFENEGSDYEMVTLSNVQPTDEIVFESDHFVHSFINISFGESDSAAVTHSLTVRDSNFTAMTSHSAISIADIDFNTNDTKQRGISYFEGNSLSHCNGPSSIVEIALIENNDNVEDDYRVILDANTFSDNAFVNDLIAVRSMDAGKGGAPSLYVVSNQFDDNHVDSLLYCDGGDHIGALTTSSTPFVRAISNAFSGNDAEIALLDLTECELELSASTISDHHFLVSLSTKAIWWKCTSNRRMRW
jgi:hypothetical protein